MILRVKSYPQVSEHILGFYFGCGPSFCQVRFLLFGKNSEFQTTNRFNGFCYANSSDNDLIGSLESDWSSTTKPTDIAVFPWNLFITQGTVEHSDRRQDLLWEVHGENSDHILPPGQQMPCINWWILSPLNQKSLLGKLSLVVSPWLKNMLVNIGPVPHIGINILNIFVQASASYLSYLQNQPSDLSEWSPFTTLR